jgi:hypothetical protein
VAGVYMRIVQEESSFDDLYTYITTGAKDEILLKWSAVSLKARADLLMWYSTRF